MKFDQIDSSDEDGNAPPLNNFGLINEENMAAPQDQDLVFH